MIKSIIRISIPLLLVSCQSNTSFNISPVNKEIIETKVVSLSTSPSPTLCPEGMVEVVGNYCPEVEQICINLDMTVHNANGFVKCDEYKSPSKCLSAKKIPMHFCIDEYEWPNKKGALPEVMISWNQMASNCKSQGKRICKDVEWTQACEGPDMLPYPYGYKRSSATCNIDRPQISGFDPGRDVMTPSLVSKLDQRVASGAMPNCVSPYGVHDMTGNVDESVVNSSGKPYNSAEMGGHWVKGARNRCRPRTIVHNESFQYYEIGGRCCKDIND